MALIVAYLSDIDAGSAFEDLLHLLIALLKYIAFRGRT
jgi:hypothetical protein